MLHVLVNLDILRHHVK